MRKIRDSRPKGHAFFLDARARLVICDDSGETPDRTDDGVLYVAEDYPIEIDRHGARCPLTCAKHAPISLADAEWLIAVRGMRVRLGRTYLQAIGSGALAKDRPDLPDRDLDS